MKRLFIPIIIALLLSGCESPKNKLYLTIQKVDSLLIEGHIKTADSIFRTINQEDINNDDTRAYYYLTKTAADIMKDENIDNDSLIDFSVKHYEKTDNDTMIARAYYYKGIVLFFNGKNKEALYYMKKAETKERETETPWLRDLIYSNLSYINHELGAKKTALEYAKKELEHAKKRNEPYNICFAYNNLSKIYYDLNKKDSTYICIFKMEPYLDKIHDKESLSYFLNNIGYAYYEKGNLLKAESLCKRADSLFHNINNAVNIAKIYYDQKKEREADSITQMILCKVNAESKAEILQFLAERAEKDGKFKEATALLRRAKAMQDSINDSKQPEETIGTQRDYEQERLIKDIESRESKTGAITVLAVIIILAAGFILHRKRMNRVGKIIAENNKKIETYSKQIEKLEQSDTRRSNEIASLEKKIQKLKKEQSDIIRNGKTLYEGIRQGGNTAKWNRKNFEEFIEFYRIEHPKALEEVETNHKRLSTTNIFYLIITNMGYDDDKAQHILCMSQGAFRTMKSRIKSKRAS